MAVEVEVDRQGGPGATVQGKGVVGPGGVGAVGVRRRVGRLDVVRPRAFVEPQCGVGLEGAFQADGSEPGGPCRLGQVGAQS